MKKGLAGIVLVGIGGIGLVSCSKHPEYHYEGNLRGEKVTFSESYTTFLTVQKKDGSKVTYTDRLESDLFLESVTVTKDGNRTEYSRGSKNPAVREFLAQAQVEFNDYLKKIFEEKTKTLTPEKNE